MSEARPSPGQLSVMWTFAEDSVGEIDALRLARNVLSVSQMSLPRQVLPNSAYMVTRRCTQRQFLLRPDEDTNNAFIYCLTEAACRYGIDVLLPCAMSNHTHYVIYDRFGTVIEFYEHFHKMLAKCQNSLLGRWENFWSTEQVCVVRLESRDDVIAKLVYVACNPVNDGLVERVHQWPGVNGFGALVHGRSLQARRPTYFFRTDGKMPKTVTLELTIPPELGSRDEIIRELRERVAAVEAQQERMRADTGKRVLGRRSVLLQSWRDSPTSREPRRNLRPRVAARCKWARIEALQRNREFLDAYRDARRAWLGGKPTPFPIGTYWLRRFVGVPIATA